MDRPPESLKPVADRLARLALSIEGSELIRMMKLAGLYDPLAPDDSSPNAGTAEATDPLCVGIWERRYEEGKSCFVRRKEWAGQWHFWANVGRIEPKGSKRRIALLGESVARGFLYDPQFNPAMALEKLLQSQLGEDLEVVDLAKTDLKMDGLALLARSARLLEPDAIVIFAGNNWRPSPKSPEELRLVANTLREHGILGLKRCAEDKLVDDSRRLVELVASLYQAEGIPVVWVIPEFNLGDWWDQETNAPWLGGNANEEWFNFRQKAREALRNGNTDEASELAQRMIDLDGGVSATGFSLLAECSRRQGNLQAARRYLEMKRDAFIWDSAIGISPRPFSVAQRTLRHEIKANGMEMVDLPEVFHDHLNGKLPDRNMFIDYCHLNSEGIKVAMTATAARLIGLFKGEDRRIDFGTGQPAAPSPEVEGGAAFLAAIHNAHWGQDYELTNYYCLRALQYSPKISQAMVRFLDLQTRRAPIWMCKSAGQLTDLASDMVQRYLFRFNTQALDKLLCSAIVGGLKKVGVSAQEQLDKLRLEEHSVSGRNIDLLDIYYCRRSAQQREHVWKHKVKSDVAIRADYYLAYEFESLFTFIAKAKLPVRLRLTCRLPRSGAGARDVVIEVNGEVIGLSPIGRNWTTWNCDVPGKVIRDGLNEILVRWPQPVFSADEELEAAADDMLIGRIPELYPVFGEIHSFVAAKASEPENVIQTSFQDADLG